MKYICNPLKRLFCLMLALVTLALAPVSALAEYKAIVTSSTRVYAAVSAKAPSAKVSKGTIVTVKDTKSGVAKISKSGNVGYMDLSDLKKVQSTKTAVSGRVYASASTGAKSTAIGKGVSVNLIDVNGSWAMIERSGHIGYVKKAILQPYYKGTGSASKSREDVVIAAAKGKLGCDYSYGCNGPKSFDCSGLVRYAFNKVGITMGRTAFAQGYGKGTKISYANLKPGDVVCFNTNDNDGDLSDHTGIYLGGGKFIHASSAGDEVMISSMSSGYYRNVFSWGRRVL